MPGRESKANASVIENISIMSRSAKETGEYLERGFSIDMDIAFYVLAGILAGILAGSIIVLISQTKLKTTKNVKVPF